MDATCSISAGGKVHDRPSAPSNSTSAFDAVAEADPDTIESIWTDVRKTRNMSHRGNGPARGARARRGGTPRGAGSEAGESSPSASVSRDTYDPSESQTTPGSIPTSTARTVSPRSPKFTSLVLRPRGIHINDTNSIVPSAFVHFGTAEPHDTCDVDYCRIDGLAGASIWLSMDQAAVNAIAAEYKEMRGLGLCEEEFATFAKDTFFRGERRSAAISEDRQWRAERMLQLVCPPKENAHWRVPPLVDPGPAAAQRMAEDWSWDVRPDCSYWLSLKGFNPRYRFQIQNCTFVKDWITCPYFTIEFKRPGLSEDVAVAQVAAAGSIALYNRHRLRKEALNVSKAGWKPEDTIALRHYALTIVGPKFVFWILRPLVDPSGTWKGCKTTRLCGADCTDEFGVREMLTWTNEIHRWALSEHGPACERDIKIVLRGGGVRTSEIG